MFVSSPLPPPAARSSASTRSHTMGSHAAGSAAMNAGFRGAAAHYVSIKPALTHSQEVCHLYRRALRTLGSWAIDREVFNTEGLKMRARFRNNIDASPAKAASLLAQGHAEMNTWTHPDRYLINYLPGGSLFMRNPPLPVEVCYPHGVPEGVSKRELNVDMSNVREGEMAKGGRVLVDSINKTYW